MAPFSSLDISLLFATSFQERREKGERAKV
jgi:hypothetical protein